MTPADVKAFLELGRAHGLRRLKVDGFEAEFGHALAADEPRTVPIGEDKGAPTEDEMLFASSPEGAPDFKNGQPVFVTRLPFGGVAPVARADEVEP